MFILGFIFFFIIEYLVFRYSITQNSIIYTKGISTDIITYTHDYQELLSVRLGENMGYFVIKDRAEYIVLHSHWSIFDIKDWIESLIDQDFSVIIEFVIKTEEVNKPRVILSKEFMINNCTWFNYYFNINCNSNRKSLRLF